MTDEGILFWCLNLRVTRDHSKGLLKIDQSQYAQEILRRFSMTDCNSRVTRSATCTVCHVDTCCVDECYADRFCVVDCHVDRCCVDECYADRFRVGECRVYSKQQ